MLPPVMDVVVVWHPNDPLGPPVGDALVDHFHGTMYSGLIGGAVEVYVRSVGWRGTGTAPRPLPTPGADATSARYVAVVPLMSRAMADAVSSPGPWRDYIAGIGQARQARPDNFAYLPLVTSGKCEGSTLERLLGERQRVGHVADREAVADRAWRRDLVQALAQFVHGPGARIRVFISHTRQEARPGAPVTELTKLVRKVIDSTRLNEFFDTHDLQPGQDWAQMLREAAAGSALLALRSDLYPSRAWCQEEVFTAKVAGTPVVIADALDVGEERGSFLMDHVPRMPIRRSLRGGWSQSDVERALGLLVDEALKRALWRRQQELASETETIKVAWWAPHAPEPITLAAWLNQHPELLGARGSAPLLVLHPDPPLGDTELAALQQVFRLTGATGTLDVVTSRQLASRLG